MSRRAKVGDYARCKHCGRMIVRWGHSKHLLWAHQASSVRTRSHVAEPKYGTVRPREIRYTQEGVI